MRAFANLLDRLAFTPQRNGKLTLLRDFMRDTLDPERGLTVTEIVASALQDSGRAVVIGTASYGKGTVQTVVRPSNDGELTVTWAQIITAGGYQLNTHGVVPTFCTSEKTDTSASADALLAEDV